MRTMLFIVAILAVALLPAADATAQTFTAYFDQAFTQGAKDCPGSGVLDTLYVVGSGFNAFLAGASYQVTYPASMLFLADVNLPPVSFGTSPTGIALGFAVPQNGFFAVLLQRVAFMWNCNDCSAGQQSIVISGNPNLNPGSPEWTDWPDNNLFNAVGMTSLVCATVPNEDTTWGQIKSIYTD